MEMNYDYALPESIREASCRNGWKMILGAILLVLVDAFLGIRAYGVGWYTICIVVITVLLWSCMLAIHLRSLYVIRARFCLTEDGILVKPWLGKAVFFPWTDIETVDEDEMEVYGNDRITILRCFLTLDEKTENTLRGEEEAKVSDYFKARKRCFVMETSEERKQNVQSLWDRAREEADNA